MKALDEHFERLAARSATERLPDLRFAAFERKFVLSRTVRLLLSAALAALAFLTTSPGAHGATPPSRVLLVGALLVPGCLFALSGAAPGESKRLVPPLRRLFPALLLAGLFGTLLGHGTHTSYEEFAADGGGMGCLIHATFTTLLVTLGLFSIWRRTDPYSPRALGAFYGVLGGLLGALSVTLACPSRETLHLLIAHGCATLLFLLVGYFAGRKVLSP